MQQDGNYGNNPGMPPYQPITPYTPEQLQLWQQIGIPQQQFTPEILQYMQQQGIAQPQVTPEMMAAWQQQLYQMQMQQMQQMQQIQGMPEDMLRSAEKERRRQEKKQSKQNRNRSPLGTFLRIVLVLAVLGGGTWFVLDSQKSSAPTTAVIEMGTLGTSYRGDALIVRNETAIESEGVQSIEYEAQEGASVYAGDLVCYVYSTGYSTKEVNTLQDYRDQIKDYQRNLLKSETSFDQKMTRLENDVIQRGLEVRSLVQGARGNLINQEKLLDTVISQRQNYFRSKYSSDTRLSRLYDDESTQEQRIDSWIKQSRATYEGLVSFYTDGYEQALTPATYEKYTPTEVRSMINGQRPETSTASRGRTNIYRLVKKNNYAVLMLIKDNTWNPVEGSTHKLMLEHFSNTVVNAQVLSFTRSGGELLVRLAVAGDVSPVLYMRSCSAELGEYMDCMKVPVSALIEQNGSRGVVITDGEHQIFVPVNVVTETNGSAYISAIQTGVLSVGQTVLLFH